MPEHRQVGHANVGRGSRPLQMPSISGAGATLKEDISFVLLESFSAPFGWNTNENFVAA